MSLDNDAIIRLLLGIGQHEDVEAELQEFFVQMQQFEWFNGFRFWLVQSSQDGSACVALKTYDKLRKGQIAEMMFPDLLPEIAKLNPSCIISNNIVFFQASNNLVLGIATSITEEQLTDTFRTLQPAIQKFANYAGRLLKKNLTLMKQSPEVRPFNSLIFNQQLQQKAMATLSHELRNPLNLILGYSGFLQESGLNATQNDYASIIRDSAQGLYQTVKKAFQLLYVSTGRIVDEEMDFRIVDVIRLLEAQLKPHAVAKGLNWSVVLPQEAGKWLVGDMNRLHDVLYYLTENAIKFSSEGTIELKVSYLGSQNGRNDFDFVVSDQGKGVDERYQQRIFEFFIQEDDSITRNYGGLGLGLSLADFFVSRLGGQLKLKSYLSRGSSFSFQLGFVPCTNHTTDDIAAYTPDPSVCAKINVLIVDDDEYQRKMAAHILRNWNISFAASGIDAIEHIRNNPDTHIILMDIRMPEMDGITATRIIRNELATKATIIAVSGEALETTVEECFEAGMNAFISKPFEREQLLRTILLHYAPLRQMQPDLIKLRPVDKLSGLRGLVVEDNKMIQLLTMRYLRDLECIAELAVDIKTALEKIAINQYDFILLDLHLPDGTGYEVAQSVRKNKESHTCLIAYSGEDSDETRAKCKAAGINGIILKSYHTSQELAIKINRFIDEFLSNRAHLEQQKLSKSAQTDYDLTKVNEIIGENTEDFVMLLKMFVEHSGTTLNQLIEASEKDDLVTLSRHAHSLKSSAKQFGMDRAAELLFALELRTGILDADQRKAMCSELREIFDRALPNIVSDIEKMKG